MELSLPEQNLLLPNGISVCFEESEHEKKFEILMKKAKGQLISKGLVGVFNFSKKRTKTSEPKVSVS